MYNIVHRWARSSSRAVLYDRKCHKCKGKGLGRVTWKKNEQVGRLFLFFASLIPEGEREGGREREGEIESESLGYRVHHRNDNETRSRCQCWRTVLILVSLSAYERIKKMCGNKCCTPWVKIVLDVYLFSLSEYYRSMVSVIDGTTPRVMMQRNVFNDFSSF